MNLNSLGTSTGGGVGVGGINFGPNPTGNNTNTNTNTTGSPSPPQQQQQQHGITNKSFPIPDARPRADIALYLGDIQDHIITMFQNLLAYEKFSVVHIQII